MSKVHLVVVDKFVNTIVGDTHFRSGCGGDEEEWRWTVGVHRLAELRQLAKLCQAAEAEMAKAAKAEAAWRKGRSPHRNLPLRLQRELADAGAALSSARRALFERLNAAEDEAKDLVAIY